MSIKRIEYIREICKNPYTRAAKINAVIFLCFSCGALVFLACFILGFTLEGENLFLFLFSFLAPMLILLSLPLMLLQYYYNIKHDIRYASFKACLDASEKHNEVIARWNSMVPYLISTDTEDPNISRIYESVISTRGRLIRMLDKWDVELKASRLGSRFASSVGSSELRSKQVNIFFDELETVAREVAHLEASFSPAVRQESIKALQVNAGSLST